MPCASRHRFLIAPCADRAILPFAVMRTIVGAVATLAATTLPTPAVARVDVLLLGDGFSETQVQPALEAAGHTVTFGGLYYQWDGVTPNVQDFDVVVLLDGYNWGQNLIPTAMTALTGFVASGCGLVATEWTTYDIRRGFKPAALGTLMPTNSPDASYGYYDTWTVLDRGHPLAAGVPASWFDAAGWSTINAKFGTTVVIDGTGANPLLSYGRQNGGTVVHLNHGMSTGTIEPNALRLLSNAARFASCSLLFLDGFESGDTSGWSAAIP